MRWSRYLEGNKEILSEDEKGAVLFAVEQDVFA